MTGATGASDAATLARIALDAAPDLVFLLDADGRFRFFNQRLEDLLGYRQDQLLGEHYAALVVAKDQGRAARLFQESGSRRPPRRALLRVRPGPGRARREPLWLELTAAAAARADGFAGVCVTAREPAQEPLGDAANLAAHRDPLTGLANRAFFERCLGAALRKRRRGDRRLAVMFMDLDGFKEVNDSLGHAAGDCLLRAVAARLRAALRPGDLLARFGGDEFTLLLTNARPRAAAAAVADKLSGRLQEAFTAAGERVRIGVAVGIAMHPGGGDTVGALLENADAAMYQAKRTGRVYRFYRAPPG